MGKKSPEPTPVPDPWETAQADAAFNRIDQITPYGSLTYSGPNRATSTLSLNPEVQALLDSQMGIDQSMLDQAMGRLGDLDGNPINLDSFGPIQSQIDTTGINFSGMDNSGLPSVGLPQLSTYNDSAPNFSGAANYSPSEYGVQQSIEGTALQNFVPSNYGVQRSIDGTQLPTFNANAGDIQNGLNMPDMPALPTDIQQYRGDVEDAYFQRSRRLLEPQFQRQEDALRDRLANQGLPQTGDAFRDQYSQFNTDRGNTFANVADQAVMMGGQEASRQLANILGTRQQGVNEALTGGQFANNAQNQLFGQNLAGYGANFNAAQNQFNQGLAQGQFANSAQGQQFGQDLSGYGANFNAAQSRFGQNMAQGQFANQAAQQDQNRALANFGVGMEQSGFNNQTAQQAMQNAMGINQFNNSINQQGFQNESGLRNQLFGENLTSSQMNNQAAQMQAAFQQQLLQNQNAGRTQALNESLGIRGNQFNELASLLGLQQVQQPGMENFFGPSNVDFLGAQGLATQTQMANNQMQNQANQAGMGGLFGIGSALITGGGAAVGGQGGSLWSGIFG